MATKKGLIEKTKDAIASLFGDEPPGAAMSGDPTPMPPAQGASRLPAKKASRAATKTTAKQTTAKRTTAKKAPARKSSTGRAPAKKVAAKKSIAKKSTAKKTAKKPSSARELITPHKGGAQYMRRGTGGRFKEGDDVGRSQKADKARAAKTTVQSGHGDEGDRKPRQRTKPKSA